MNLFKKNILFLLFLLGSVNINSNPFIDCCLSVAGRMARNSYNYVSSCIWSSSEENSSKSETDSLLKKDEKKLKFSLCSQIGFANSESIPKEKLGDKKRGNKFDNPYNAYEWKKDYIYNPKTPDIQKRSFQILDSAETQIQKTKKCPWFNNSILSSAEVWRNLNLVCGVESDKKKKEETNGLTIYLASILGKDVSTQMGKANLCGIIARPTDNVDLLLTRQAIIKSMLGITLDQNSMPMISGTNSELEIKIHSDDSIQSQSTSDALSSMARSTTTSNSSNILKELHETLQELATEEKFLTGFWDKGYPPFAFKDYYQSLFSSYLNRSTTALEIKAFIGYIQKIMHEGINIASSAMLTIFGVWALSYYLHHYEPTEGLSSYADHFAGVSGEIFAVISYINGQLGHIPFLSGIMTIAGLNNATWIRKSLQWAHAELLEHDLMLKVLMHISKIVKCMKKIHQIVCQLPNDTANKLIFFSELDAFLNSEDEKLQQLFAILDTNTFATDADDTQRYVFRYGRVLCAWGLLLDCINKFELPLAAIGEIDAYAGLAILMKKSSTNRNAKFCFPTYDTRSENPYINATSFWNPFVDSENVVTNDLTFGRKFEIPNIILTAPNSAGKSILLKGTGILITCMQSTAIAPATSLTATPFSYADAIINVQDNQVGKDAESLFQAQVRRTFGEFTKKSEEFGKQGKKCLLLADELFSGTNPRSAGIKGFEFGEIIGGKSNCFTIISTHYDKLTELGKTGNFVNMQIPVAITESGIRRLFKLKSGINNQDITDYVLAEALGINAKVDSEHKKIQEVHTKDGKEAKESAELKLHADSAQ